MNHDHHTDSPANKPLIYCGIAGWSYPDWNGYVYPTGTKDKLHYAAQLVDTIEINSTFYRPATVDNSTSWLQRTSDIPDFFFTAKLHQDFTHRGILEESAVRTFSQGLAPLSDNGKLRHLLAQFPYNFANTPQAKELLKSITTEFASITNLVLELRHNSWQSPSALQFLQDLDVTVANLDYPTTRDSFNLHKCRVGKQAYLRLHGRNAQAWFDKGAGRDQTYNYLYSQEELDQIVDRAVDLASTSNSLTIIANNHYQGKEVANALQLKARLTDSPVSVPPLLQQHYPHLRSITPRTTDATAPGSASLPDAS